MEWLSLPWATLGPAGLCAMFVVAILRGWLLPGATVDRLLSSRDERIGELRAALAASEEREKVLAEQNQVLMEVARTAEQVLRALPAAERD